jgi:hypothetical protein
MTHQPQITLSIPLAELPSDEGCLRKIFIQVLRQVGWLDENANFLKKFQLSQEHHELNGECIVVFKAKLVD